MTSWNIAARYGLFAGSAIFVNLATQWLTFQALRGPNALAISILAGTATGLAVKYLLDKRWIFQFVAKDWAHETRTATRYGITGAVTTLLFWGTEVAFHLAFEQDGMRYVGGGLGLTAGYILKYRMDKSYVFSSRQA